MNRRRVFVYGSLKRGFQLHRLLGQRAEFVAQDAVQGLTLVSVGPFPAAVLEGGGRVKGEVYDVEEPVFRFLRHMEEDAGYLTSMTTTDGGRDVTLWVGPSRFRFYGPVIGAEWKEEHIAS